MTDNFAIRLANILAEKDWTQSDLAAEMWGRVPNKKGYLVAKGRDRIHAWLKKGTLPTLENRELLCRVLGVTPAELLLEGNLGGGRRGADYWSLTSRPDGLAHLQVDMVRDPRIAHEALSLLLKAT